MHIYIHSSRIKICWNNRSIMSTRCVEKVLSQSWLRQKATHKSWRVEHLRFKTIVEWIETSSKWLERASSDGKIDFGTETRRAGISDATRLDLRMFQLFVLFSRERVNDESSVCCSFAFRTSHPSHLDFQWIRIAELCSACDYRRRLNGRSCGLRCSATNRRRNRGRLSDTIFVLVCLSLSDRLSRRLGSRRLFSRACCRCWNFSGGRSGGHVSSVSRPQHILSIFFGQITSQHFTHHSIHDFIIPQVWQRIRIRLIARCRLLCLELESICGFWFWIANLFTFRECR